MRSQHHYLILIFLVFPLMGCATQSMDSNGYSTRRYFGWLEVTDYKERKANLNGSLGDEAKASDKLPKIERVKAVGVRMDNGFAVGYFDESRIALPRECRLVIVVKDLDQIDKIAKNYPQLLKAEELCVKPLDF